MTKATLITRSLFGLVFVVFGFNKIVPFLPMPPMEGVQAAFFGGLAATGYFFPVLGVTEVVTGAMLLTGMYVPLALVVLAPVVLHIFLFHVFVATQGMPIALVLGALQIYLSFFSKEYSPTIKQLFKKKKK